MNGIAGKISLAVNEFFQPLKKMLEKSSYISDDKKELSKDGPEVNLDKLTAALIVHFSKSATNKFSLDGRIYKASLSKELDLKNDIKPVNVEIDDDDEDEVSWLLEFFRACFDLFIQPLLDASCTSRVGRLEREFALAIKMLLASSVNVPNNTGSYIEMNDINKDDIEINQMKINQMK